MIPRDDPRGVSLILLGVLTRDDPKGSTLDELESLARTVGYDVVGRVTQKMDPPHPTLYMGKGKIHEVRDMAAELRATRVLANHDLSPAQGRNMEKALDGVRVMDRTEVILEIFSRHARTAQAKLQVELARLEYLRPRLKRMWTHLSRTGGKVGARGGPGEKQIEIDRRIIRDRVQELRDELTEIRERKEREVEARAKRRFDAVSLVGYTNAGKSTLASRLTGTEFLIADQLFSTLDTRTRSWKLAGGRSVLLSDSVGFIRRLPHHLIECFHATLTEALHADLLLHVVDASHPEADRQIEAVEEVLAYLGIADRPLILVANKVDAAPDGVDIAPYARHRKTVAVSAATGEGISALEQAVREHLESDRPLVRVEIPLERSNLVSALHEMGCVERQNYKDTVVEVDVFLDRALVESLPARGALSVQAITPGE